MAETGLNPRPAKTVLLKFNSFVRSTSSLCLSGDILFGGHNLYYGWNRVKVAAKKNWDESQPSPNVQPGLSMRPALLIQRRV